MTETKWLFSTLAKVLWSVTRQDQQSIWSFLQASLSDFHRVEGWVLVEMRYYFLACLCKETTQFLWTLNWAHRREDGFRQWSLRSLFCLSISSWIDFEIYRAGFFFTRTDLIGAWTSRTSWNRVLKTLTLSSASSNKSTMHHDTVQRSSTISTSEKCLNDQHLIEDGADFNTGRARPRRIRR